jgi:hypothetical protein
MIGLPEDFYMIAWVTWAAICAWAPRYLAVRKWGKAYGVGAYFIGYFSWPLMFVVGLIIVGWTGMQMYGFDRSDPWQMAGWIILFLTPLGLPVLYGAPFVMLFDLSRFVIRRLRRPSVPPSP